MIRTRGIFVVWGVVELLQQHKVESENSLERDQNSGADVNSLRKPVDLFDNLHVHSIPRCLFGFYVALYPASRIFQNRNSLTERLFISHRSTPSKLHPPGVHKRSNFFLKSRPVSQQPADRDRQSVSQQDSQSPE